MDDFAKEEKTTIKHGWLTKTTNAGTKLLNRWKQKYFAFCEITSREKTWLHLFVYKDFVAFKARKMPEKCIDISEASDIGIGPEDMNGHKHIILIQVPGKQLSKQYYLSASSCEDMFLWNLALRSRRFNDNSMLESPTRKSNSYAGIYEQRHSIQGTPTYVNVNAKPDPRNRSQSENMINQMPCRSEEEVFKSNMKLKKRLYCKACLIKEKEEEDTYIYIETQNPEDQDGIEELYEDPLYLEIGQQYDLPSDPPYDLPVVDELYDSQPKQPPPGVPARIKPPKPLPGPSTSSPIYNNIPMHEGTEHESDSVSLEDLVRNNSNSKSKDGETQNTGYLPIPFNISTVSLPAIYGGTGYDPLRYYQIQEKHRKNIRCLSASSRVNIETVKIEQRRNTDGKIEKRERQHAILAKTVSVPILTTMQKMQLPKREADSTNLLTDGVHRDGLPLRAVPSQEDPPSINVKGLAQNRPRSFTDLGYVALNSLNRSADTASSCVQVSEDDRDEKSSSASMGKKSTTEFLERNTSFSSKENSTSLIKSEKEYSTTQVDTYGSKQEDAPTLPEKSTPAEKSAFMKPEVGQSRGSEAQKEEALEPYQRLTPIGSSTLTLLDTSESLQEAPRISDKPIPVKRRPSQLEKTPKLPEKPIPLKRRTPVKPPSDDSSLSPIAAAEAQKSAKSSSTTELGEKSTNADKTTPPNEPRSQEAEPPKVPEQPKRNDPVKSSLNVQSVPPRNLPLPAEKSSSSSASSSDANTTLPVKQTSAPIPSERSFDNNDSAPSAKEGQASSSEDDSGKLTEGTLQASPRLKNFYSTINNNLKDLVVTQV